MSKSIKQPEQYQPWLSDTQCGCHQPMVAPLPAHASDLDTGAWRSKVLETRSGWAAAMRHVVEQNAVSTVFARPFIRRPHSMQTRQSSTSAVAVAGSRASVGDERTTRKYAKLTGWIESYRRLFAGKRHVGCPCIATGSVNRGKSNAIAGPLPAPTSALAPKRTSSRVMRGRLSNAHVCNGYRPNTSSASVEATGSDASASHGSSRSA